MSFNSLYQQKLCTADDAITHLRTSKNDINYVVTEYGVAQLRGKSAKQRAQEMIFIAHPDFRAELTDAARKMQLL